MSKISVSLTDEAVTAVEDIKASRGISTSEAIRRSIAITKYLTTELDNGSVFLIRYKDGKEEALRFVWTDAPRLTVVRDQEGPPA